VKPVCVKCERFFRPKKNGFYFLEGAPAPGEEHALPGLAEPERWAPYKLWAGDLWECPDCGATILSGFGSGPISYHHDPDFETLADALGARQLLVKDC
jgi:hypothetical protein